MVAASLLLDSAPMAMRNEDLIAESNWFAASLGTLDTEDESYNRKRMSSSRMKHERGTRDREQGGEID
jgi:hypothetical protein